MANPHAQHGLVPPQGLGTTPVLFPFDALPDPPMPGQRSRFLNVTYREATRKAIVDTTEDLVPLVNHHFFGFRLPPKLAQTTGLRADKVFQFLKLLYWMDPIHRPKTIDELKDLSRDAGPRLLCLERLPAGLLDFFQPYSVWYPNIPPRADPPQDPTFNRINLQWNRPLNELANVPDVWLEQSRWVTPNQVAIPAAPAAPALPMNQDANVNAGNDITTVGHTNNNITAPANTLTATASDDITALIDPAILAAGAIGTSVTNNQGELQCPPADEQQGSHSNVFALFTNNDPMVTGDDGLGVSQLQVPGDIQVVIPSRPRQPAPAVTPPLTYLSFADLPLNNNVFMGYSGAGSPGSQGSSQTGGNNVPGNMTPMDVDEDDSSSTSNSTSSGQAVGTTSHVDPHVLNPNATYQSQEQVHNVPTYVPVCREAPTVRPYPGPLINYLPGSQLLPVVQDFRSSLIRHMYRCLEHDTKVSSLRHPPEVLVNSQADLGVGTIVARPSAIKSDTFQGLPHGWTGNTDRMPVRTRGPVSDGESSAIDCSVVACKLLDIGGTRMDLAANRSEDGEEQWEDLDLAWIEAANLDWDMMTATGAAAARERLQRLFRETYANCRNEKEIDLNNAQQMWTLLGPSFGQFSARIEVTETRCLGCGPDPKVNTVGRMLSYFAPGQDDSDRRGVDISQYLSRAVDSGDVEYDCLNENCPRPTGVRYQGRFHEYPMRMIVLPHETADLQNHTADRIPVDILVPNLNSPNKTRVIYRWLGGIYSQDGKSWRVFWSDVLREQLGNPSINQKAIQMYDGRLNHNALIGGIAPHDAARSRVPREWYRPGCKKVLFYERLLEPSPEMVRHITHNAESLLHSLQQGTSIYHYQIPWQPHVHPNPPTWGGRLAPADHNLVRRNDDEGTQLAAAAGPAQPAPQQPVQPVQHALSAANPRPEAPQPAVQPGPVRIRLRSPRRPFTRSQAPKSPPSRRSPRKRKATESPPELTNSGDSPPRKKSRYC